MALVGEAHIIVRAITNKVDGDVTRGFSRLNGGSAKSAGARLAQAFSKGWNKDANAGTFKRLGNAADEVGKKFEGTARKFSTLVKAGYVVQTGLGVLIGALSAVIGGIVSLGGAALGAAGSLVVVGNAAFAMAAGMIAAKLALGGVGKALAALNKQGAGAADNTSQIESAEQRLAQVIETNRENLVDANNAVRDAQLALNEAIKEGQEEIQQLGFEAEDAALSEQKAALELERAREALARVQDLPPNSRARKEAELAYQEAELNLRKAKDKSADLTKEQDRLARAGVAGTDAVVKASGRLAEAEAAKARTIRDGLRQQADAERALADARKGNASGGADPFAGLNQFQIDFVMFLQGLKPLLDQIKLQVAGAFLPPLQEAITTLVDGLYPTVLSGLTLIAGAMGTAVKSIASAMVEAKNVENLGKMFETSAKLIESFGRIIGNVYSAMLGVLVAAAPQAQRFADFLEKATGRFKAFTSSAEGEAAMAGFFQRSGDAAAKFGEIIGNIFGGIGGIINANLGPGTGGDYLLNWLTQATQKFQDLGKAGENGISPMAEYFNKVAVNSQKVFSAIGALLGELIKLGTNQAIGKTFDILAQGAPYLGQILQAGVEAGPAFAELIVSLTRIGAALADAAQPTAFFNTLNVVARVLADFFESSLVQSILKVIGPIIGVAGAIGTMVTGASVGIGIITFLITSLQGKLQALFAFLKANPVLVIIGLIVAAMIYLYNTNEQFAAQMNAVFAQLASAFNQVVAALQPVIETVISQLVPVFGMIVEAVGQILIALMPVISNLITQLVPVFVLIAETVGQVIEAIAPLIPQLLSVLIPAIISVVEALVPLIDALITALVPAFAQIMEAILPLVVMIIETLVPVIVQLVEAFLPLITQIIDAVIPVLVQLIEAFAPLITQIIDAVMPVIIQLVEAFMPLVTMIIETVVPIIVQLVEAFMPPITMILEAVMPILSALVEAFMPIIQTILDLLIPIIGFLVDAFEFIIPIVLDVVKAIADFLMPIIKFLIEAFVNLVKFFPKIGQAFQDVWNGVVNFFKGIVNFLIGLVEGMVNGMIDSINNFTRPFKDAIAAVVGFFGGGKITFGNIPHVRLARLATGGVVSPSQGGTLAQIAEAGKPERVEPLDANGMSKRDRYMVDLIKAQKGNAGTINITVNPAPGMDERELAAAISREISYQMRRGAVA